MKRISELSEIATKHPLQVRPLCVPERFAKANVGLNSRSFSQNGHP